LEFEQGPGAYVLETGDEVRHDRTLGVSSVLAGAQRPRDESYQAGFPMLQRGRHVDRGHLIPHSGGGDFGPNIYAQDWALNRGLSEDGRRYRAMERQAITHGGFFFVGLRYCDETDYPALVEIGTVIDGVLDVAALRNRFDDAALAAFPPPDDQRELIADQLRSLTSAGIGDLGEEAVRALLEADGIPFIGVGDSELERDEGRQDLDMVVLFGDEVTVIEVKSRHASKLAGSVTRAGNLRRPQLRAREGRSRQGSAEYAAPRLEQFMTVDGTAAARLYVVDLRLLVIQWFPLDEHGRAGRPTELPVSALDEVTAAFEVLREAGRA
jgi:Holliday junction resolvase-like predicted endonuclease